MSTQQEVNYKENESEGALR